MTTKLYLSIMLALTVALAAGPAVAGEYHAGNNLICADCHTMHYSMQHGWSGGAVSTTAGNSGGNWLGATGPNEYLLKAPANDLCLSCHDGQSFAPDVLGVNANVSPSQGRQAGALNDLTGAAPYYTWTGHTLGSTATPPGYDPTVIGAPANWYNPEGGLECISCHSQHGSATAYRNLGSFALGSAATAARPTYVLGTTNDTTKDVWVNIATPYTAGSGSAATFNPYYDTANVSFNRNDASVGSVKTSNRMSTLCAACHGDFHGGPGDAAIGATPSALDGFLRHPTAQATIGAAAAQNFGGHSSLSRFVGATTKVKVLASDRSGYTDATPTCITCHKGHGNQNPFGLVFLNRTATAVTEEGGTGTGQGTDTNTGQRNLCGQCHSQGA